MTWTVETAKSKNKEFDMPGSESHKGPAGTLNVAYLGPEASFSHQAAIEVFHATGSSTQQQPPVSLHPLPSFPAIFSAIQDSPRQHSTSSLPADNLQYDYALLPIENSTNGSVVQVLDLLAQCELDSQALYPDLEFCAEYYMPVHHCLFISPPISTQDTTTDELTQMVRTLYTHPQVWGQCGRFLSQHFDPKRVERIDVGSTSAAAQIVARNPPATESNATQGEGLNAAISSKLAGERHGLVCLAEDIEDEPGRNTTRFFVLRNKKRRRSRSMSSELQGVDHFSALRLEDGNGADSGRYKSLITFTVPHTKPGALADALAVFKVHGFNLTSIDTRPSRKRNWQYVFFVECEETSQPCDDVEGKSKVLEMLDELGKFTESLRYLGRFVDQLPREDESGTNG